MATKVCTPLAYAARIAAFRPSAERSCCASDFHARCRFGTSRDGLDPKIGGWLNGLQPDKSGTALADAAFELLKRDDNELPTAIVIATDGRENASAKSSY